MFNPAPYIDHTLLQADATPLQIADLCEEAVEFGFASVCIPPRYVKQAAEVLYGSGVQTGTVVGFPLGYETGVIKAEQAAHAVRSGAQEIDMVIPLGAARLGNYGEVADDVRQVVERAEGQLVKVILECCLFDDDAVKRALVEAVIAGGADYVKTSTGFSAAGAVLEDVQLLSAVSAGRLKVKAAGGIRDWPACRSFIEAGAARIGTSAGVAIMQQWSLHAI